MIVYLQMIDTPDDRSKFEHLYLEYRGLMFHAANQILHNEQDADFYLESDPESANAPVWLSASGDTIYCLTAPLPASTLIQIAESIPA